MPQLVKTETGSLYLIDQKKGTWKRVSATENSGDLRTDEGTFYEISLKVGEGMAMLGPPLSDDVDGRFLYTSDVVEIEEVPEA